MKTLSNITWYFPQHILTWLTLCWRQVLVTIHRAVIKYKYSLSRAPLKKRVEGWWAEKKRQSVSRIDLSSVCSTEIPTSLGKLPPHLHIHNINLK